MNIAIHKGMPEGFIELKAGNIVLYRHNNLDYVMVWADKNLKLSDQALIKMRKDFEDAS